MTVVTEGIRKCYALAVCKYCSNDIQVNFGCRRGKALESKGVKVMGIRVRVLQMKEFENLEFIRFGWLHYGEILIALGSATFGRNFWIKCRKSRMGRMQYNDEF